jgi:pimeloyl-ACP methyl ester carboxylesterase
MVLRTRTLLRALLLVQALAVGGLAWWLVASQLVGTWWLALAAAFGILVLVRMLITANNFLLTARYSSITPDDFRLDKLNSLRLFGEEFLATLLHSSWFMARARAGETLHDDARGMPVLLLHGYGCNSGYWAQLVPMLDAARISHAALDLEPIMGAIDDYVPLVQRAAEQLCARSGAPKVIIVAHSMGGLVARAYLRAHGSERVAHVFTLGTPHHGTSLANMGVGKNAAQMRRNTGMPDAPESAWLRELAASESAETRALITSFYTHHDNIVAPQTSSLLPGAHNVAFGGVGHVAMGRNRRVLARLMDEIENLFMH